MEYEWRRGNKFAVCKTFLSAMMTFSGAGDFCSAELPRQLHHEGSRVDYDDRHVSVVP